MAKDGWKGIGSEVPEIVLDEFSQFVERKGYVKWRAHAAAMLLFRVLPAGLRDELMEADHRKAKSLAKELDKALTEALHEHDAATRGSPPARRKSVAD